MNTVYAACPRCREPVAFPDRENPGSRRFPVSHHVPGPVKFAVLGRVERCARCAAEVVLYESTQLAGLLHARVLRLPDVELSPG